MNQPLELEDIAGLSLTMLGVLIEQYVSQGYADPTMYRALQASASLTEQLKARLEYNGATNTELLDGVTELIVNLRLTAMECGEVVNRIIDEHGLPVSKDTWQETNRTDGE